MDILFRKTRKGDVVVGQGFVQLTCLAFYVPILWRLEDEHLKNTGKG